MNTTLNSAILKLARKNSFNPPVLYPKLRDLLSNMAQSNTRVIRSHYLAKEVERCFPTLLLLTAQHHLSTLLPLSLPRWTHCPQNLLDISLLCGIPRDNIMLPNRSNIPVTSFNWWLEAPKVIGCESRHFGVRVAGSWCERRREVLMVVNIEEILQSPVEGFVLGFGMDRVMWLGK